ncbi:MAG TPA: FHA domain-containing protein [Steroidobacteraceae bacterium]|nr:FHA domain-containing protein [Steroidobacteraceae bacterium]
MGEKSIWNRVAGLVGAKGEARLRELPTHTRRCPAGHPMALDWAECPYCKAERPSTPDSQAGQAPASPATAPATAIAPTRYREETKMAGRLLVGVVFTFSWSSRGQLFPVYAGRNHAGAAPMTREGERTAILVTEDPAVSATQFLILYQQDTGQYRIMDTSSSHATFVNGERIDSKGIELPDDAQIRAGNTLFIFKKLLPPTAEAELRPQGDDPPVAASTLL